MHLIEELYLGWQQLTHTTACPNPVWDSVEWRRDEGARLVQQGAEAHECISGDCDHGNGFDRVQFRLLCRDCQTVHVLDGEGLGSTVTTTALTGWGQPPRKTAGMWLWPGETATPDGRPHDYLVTRDPVTPATPGALHGLITSYWDSVGTPLWIAYAHHHPDGTHKRGRLTFTHRTNALTTVQDAARWIATVQDQPQRPLVVQV